MSEEMKELKQQVQNQNSLILTTLMDIQRTLIEIKENQQLSSEHVLDAEFENPIKITNIDELVEN
jgi:hypothetical protein